MPAAHPTCGRAEVCDMLNMLLGEAGVCSRFLSLSLSLPFPQPATCVLAAGGPAVAPCCLSLQQCAAGVCSPIAVSVLEGDCSEAAAFCRALCGTVTARAVKWVMVRWDFSDYF